MWAAILIVCTSLIFRRKIRKMMDLNCRDYDSPRQHAKHFVTVTLEILQILIGSLLKK